MKKHTNIVKALAMLMCVAFLMSSFTGYTTFAEETISAENEAAVTLKISPKTLDLCEDDVATALTVTVTPADTPVSFQTGNDKVATVDSTGKVTPKGYGTTVITATATKGTQSAIATCTVNVYCTDFAFVEGANVVTAIKVPNNGKDYSVGLRCPNNFDPTPLISKMEWDTTNSTLFTASNGVINPKKSGTAQLSVRLTTTNNHGAEENITRNLSVQVIQPVTQITTDKDNYEVLPGQSVTIKAAALPEEAYDKSLSYESDNALFKVSNKGVVTVDPKATGKATITITANDGGGATKTVTVEAIKVIETIKATPERIVAIPGDIIKFDTEILPKDAKDKDVTITSDCEDVTISGNSIVVSDKIKKDVLATVSIKAKQYSEAEAKILVDVKTDTSGRILKVEAGKTAEIDFKAIAEITKEDQLTVRPTDPSIVTVTKVEKTGENQFKVTITGVKEGQAGIVITAAPDKDTSFYRYVNVTVTKAPDAPQPTEAVVDGALYKVVGDAAVLTVAADAKGKYTVQAKVKIGEKEYPVTKIAANAFKGSKITKLTIPAGITDIETGAFNGCKSLTTVTIGADVTTIGSKAFFGCGKLKKVTFKGMKLKKIGGKAFKKTKKGITFKCPKKKKSAYKKLLKGKADKGFKVK